MRDIEQYEQDYLDNPFESSLVKYRHLKTSETLNKYNPASILEVGCGLRPLYEYHSGFDELLIVEPAAQFAQAAKDGAPDNVEVIAQPLDASLAGDTPYDCIVISSLLHEVEQPVALLETAKAFADTNTVFHINVPNANSLHRRLAVLMGLIESVSEQSERQRRFQQHACFDADSLTALLESAGLSVVNMESFFIKPFTHAQMQAMLDNDIFDQSLLDGLYALSSDLPDMGAELVANARINS